MRPAVLALAGLSAYGADRGPVFGERGPTGLRGEYFVGHLNVNLSSRALERLDPVIDFDWGAGSPSPELPADSFRVRWTGFLLPSATEMHAFQTRSDDGVRLQVDEHPVIDNWADHLASDDLGARPLIAGVKVPIKLDYFERIGVATIRLSVTPAGTLSPPTEPNGLMATYFASRTLENPRVVRRDLDVDFDWGLDSPDPALDGGNFSVRWSGTVEARFSETYTFHTEGKETNEGVRLWVDGRMIIDDWAAPHSVVNTGTVPLSAGRRVPIVLEYFEEIGAAGMELRWSSPSQPKAIVSWHRLRP